MSRPASTGHVLITGGAGFIGSNLADRLAAEGERVLVYDGLVRSGVESNLKWLKSRHGEKIDIVIADVRDDAVLSRAVTGARAVFHMAAQVAVTTSFVDPLDDFSTNVAATVKLLDLVRRQAPGASVIFASTNKVYGDLADLDFALEGEAYRPLDPRIRQFGIGEDRRLDFHTPYGCSKGAADQYVLDYARSFGLRSAVLRMSCIYGQRQLGTEDQGWVAHFLIRALTGEGLTLYGDGYQVRDVLDVGDAVSAYVNAWRRIDRVRGHAFNLGGGPDNAISLRQLVAYIGTLTGCPVGLSFDDWRPGDQRYFVADARSAIEALGLAPRRPWKEGVAALARWLRENRVATSRRVAEETSV